MVGLGAFCQMGDAAAADCRLKALDPKKTNDALEDG
jgi:hypothetical protein